MKALPMTPLFGKIIFFLLLIVGYCGCKQKAKPDYEAWKSKLETVYDNDQKYRDRIEEITMTEGPGTDEYNDIWDKQTRLDSANLEIVKEMISQHGGFPGISVLGEQASSTIFLVLQHAPDQVQAEYIDLILEAARKGEINKKEAARYHDRYLMNQDLPQIYGSQVITTRILDSLTGEEIDSIFLWPMRDTTNIDSIRKFNGMEPLQRYLQF